MLLRGYPAQGLGMPRDASTPNLLPGISLCGLAQVVGGLARPLRKVWRYAWDNKVGVE